MNPYATDLLARSHQADLMREADAHRLAKVAKSSRKPAVPHPARPSGFRIALGRLAALGTTALR